MACIKDWWDDFCEWVRKIFDNAPEGAPRKKDKDKEKKEDKDGEEEGEK